MRQKLVQKNIYSDFTKRDKNDTVEKQPKASWKIITKADADFSQEQQFMGHKNQWLTVLEMINSNSVYG